MGNHVFICYAREDEAFVLKLARNLKAHGVPIWLDRWDIPPGANWNKSIDDAIHDCAKFLIVLSPAAVESKEVEGEWLTALDENRPILPVICQKGRVPSQLRTIQYVDFTSHGPEDETVLEQLVRALDESKKAPQTEEYLRQKVAEGRQERAEGGVRWPGEEEAPWRATPPTGEIRSIPPWVYGGVGVLVLVLALFIQRQQESKKKESVRPETPVAETSQTPVAETQVREREEQKATKSEQPKEKKGKDKTEMVSIPAGEFWVGCNEKVDQRCGDEEKPGRKVFLDVYSIDKYEVTVAEYRRCVEARGKGCTSPSAGRSCNWDKGGRSDHPINCIDWNQAQAYCTWVGKRLPTEAEWEKAARGTDGRVYPWGNEWDAQKANVGSSGTVAVGSYIAGVSPYGSYDMAGNVGECVQDWYAANYYRRSPNRNPKGPDSGQYKVVRGGSWGALLWYVRVSFRIWVDPGSRSGYLGVRCAQ